LYETVIAMADSKSILIGMLLGVILVVGIESAVIALLLKSYGASTSNMTSSLLKFTNASARLTNNSSAQFMSNSTYGNSTSGDSMPGNSTASAAAPRPKPRPAPPKVSVSRVNLFGDIIVKGANLTNAGELSGALFYNTVVPGFSAAPNTSENYSIMLPNYSSLQMLVYTVGAATRNFTVAVTDPQVPSFIGPNSSKNFTLAIRLPNGAYAGELNISFNATLLKGAA